MAFRTSSPSAPVASAALAYTAVAGDIEVWIRVKDPYSSSVVFLGGDSSLTSNGFNLKQSDPPLHVRVRPGDELWIRSGTGSSVSTCLLIRSA